MSEYTLQQQLIPELCFALQLGSWVRVTPTWLLVSQTARTFYLEVDEELNLVDLHSNLAEKVIEGFFLMYH